MAIKSIIFNLFSLIPFSIFSFIIILLASNTLFSQDLVLTYEQSVDMAIQQNIYLKQESNLLKVTNADKQQSLANFAPSLNAYSDAYRTDGRQYSDEESAMVNSTIDRVTYSLEANLTIFNGFQNVYLLKQSNQLHITQEKKLEREIQNIIFQASQQFLQILLDKELLIIAKENLEVQKRLMEQVDANVQLGKRTREDLLTQEALLKSIEVDVINFQNKLFTDKINLAKLLVIQPEQEFKIIAPLWDIDSLLNKNYSFDSLLILAKEHRPDIKQLEAEQKVALQGINIARSSICPSISAYYYYSSFYNSNSTREASDGNFYNIAFREQMQQNNYSQLYGFSLSVPLFNNLSTKTEIVEAKINNENIKLKYRDFEQQLYLDLKRECQNYNSYKESYIAKGKGAEAAYRSYEKQYELYRIGKGNIVSLNIENQRNMRSESEKIQAEYTLLFQQIVLDYYIGIL